MLFTMVFENESTQPPSTFDEQLLFQLADGNLDVMSALYTATSSAVYGFALSILKNATDAEDVMQETYLRIYKAAPTYRSMGKPMAWILTIVRNLALMKLRERKSEVLPEDYELSDHGTPQLATENRLVLRAALQQLTEEERQIVVLYAVSGMKHREIAALLELPLATVLSKYHRSLKKLKTIVKEGASDE